MNAAALVFGGPSDGEFYASRSSRLVALVVPPPPSYMYQPVAGPPDATWAALETYEYTLEKFAWRSWQDVMWWWAWIPAREPDRAEQIERVEGSLRLIAKLAESAMFAPAGGGSPFARRVDPWRDDHDGYEAGFAGQPVSECPYLPTDESGFHWRQGWLRGASEHHHRSGTFGAGGPVHRRDSAAYWDDRFAPGDELERLQRELAPPEVVVEPFTDSSTAGQRPAGEPFDELERLQRLQLAADATSAAERFQGAWDRVAVDLKASAAGFIHDINRMAGQLLNTFAVDEPVDLQKPRNRAERRHPSRRHGECPRHGAFVGKACRQCAWGGRA